MVEQARARRRRQRLLRHAKDRREVQAHDGVRPEEGRGQAQLRRAAGVPSSGPCASGALHRSSTACSSAKVLKLDAGGPETREALKSRSHRRRRALHRQQRDPQGRGAPPRQQGSPARRQPGHGAAEGTRPRPRCSMSSTRCRRRSPPRHTARCRSRSASTTTIPPTSPPPSSPTTTSPDSRTRHRNFGITFSPQRRIVSSCWSWVSVPIWMRHITSSQPASSRRCT